MQFNSQQFLIFFPIVLLIYFLLPRKARVVWLLIASYYFYMCWNVKYVLLLLSTTVVTWAGALWIGNIRDKDPGNKQREKRILIIVLLFNFGILALFKYASFVAETVQLLLNAVRAPVSFPTIELLLPVGISFYIFQAVGYIVDVYRGDIQPESSLPRYALFVSFFPQLVAGPIERSKNLLPQIQNLEHLELWDFKRVQRGCLMMLYGFGMKLLIADRAAVIVDHIFNNYRFFSGGAFVLAILLFAVQIYCDFAGYSNIAIGAAQIMGISLMTNFRAPYLAVSIRDLWHRWHISLSTWFRDYLYIPLGGSRKGKIKKYRNLLIIFTVSGLWHGAAWNYVLWGFMHGVFRVVGEITEPKQKEFRTRFPLGKSGRVWLHLRRWCTMGLFLFALIAFRSHSTEQMVFVYHEIFSAPFSLAGLITESGLYFGIRNAEVLLLAILIVALYLVDVATEKHIPFADWFEKQNWMFRAGFFLIGILVLLLFGVYGPEYAAGTFIYFQF